MSTTSIALPLWRQVASSTGDLMNSSQGYIYLFLGALIAIIAAGVIIVGVVRAFPSK